MGVIPESMNTLAHPASLECRSLREEAIGMCRRCIPLWWVQEWRQGSGTIYESDILHKGKKRKEKLERGNNINGVRKRKRKSIYGGKINSPTAPKNDVKPHIYHNFWGQVI